MVWLVLIRHEHPHATEPGRPPDDLRDAAGRYPEMPPAVNRGTCAGCASTQRPGRHLSARSPPSMPSSAGGNSAGSAATDLDDRRQPHLRLCIRPHGRHEWNRPTASSTCHDRRIDLYRIAPLYRPRQ